MRGVAEGEGVAVDSMEEADSAVVSTVADLGASTAVADSRAVDSTALALRVPFKAEVSLRDFMVRDFMADSMTAISTISTITRMSASSSASPLRVGVGAGVGPIIPITIIRAMRHMHMLRIKTTTMPM